MKIDEGLYRIISRATEISGREYNVYWRDSENIEGFIDPDELLTAVDDLIGEYERIEEELEDLKNDMESNYVPVSVASQYDISDRDFI